MLKIQRALYSVELYDAYVVETAGTTLASLLCPSKTGGGGACDGNCSFAQDTWMVLSVDANA